MRRVVKAKGPGEKEKRERKVELAVIREVVLLLLPAF